MMNENYESFELPEPLHEKIDYIIQRLYPILSICSFFLNILIIILLLK